MKVPDQRPHLRAARLMGEAPPASAPPLTPQEERAEIARIVPRLEAIVVRHLDSARHVGIPMGRAELLRVVDALLAEAGGQAPGALHEDEILRYAMESLYEELLAEPSNIFRHTQVDAATTRYEAMPRSFWQACLAELKRRCG